MNRGFLILFIVIALATWTSRVCRAQGASEILVGSELEFPPYATVDSQGQATGFSVDLIRAVADTMGLRVKISTGSWDYVWNRLVDGRIDVLPVVAKLPERTHLVDFSFPHTETFDAFFVRNGKPILKDLASANDREIVVMRSDYAHHALLENKFEGKLILVDTIPEGLRLVSSGKHDAFLCSKLIGTLAIKEHKINGLTVGPPIPDYKRTFSFAVKKGDAELLEKLNQGLHIIKLNGEYERIYQKWLDAEDPWRKIAKYFFPAVIIIFALVLTSVGMLVILKRLVNQRTRELAETNVALLRAGEELEERVCMRTAEMVSSNEALAREVIERRRTEKALRVSEERLQQALLVSRSFTFEWQPATDQVVRSDSCATILISGDEVLNDTGKGHFQMVHPDDRARFVQMIHELTPAANAYTTEYRVIRSDGTVVVLEEIGQATFDAASKMERVVGVATDVTTRKQVEEQLRALNEELERRVEKRTRELQESQKQVLHVEKLSAIGRLSASIAHEFNNPLQSVMTILRGLKKTLVLEEQDRIFLDLVLSESERMKNLIRSLQDFNRPSSGRRVFMDVHATIDSLILLSKSDLKRKGISTVVNYTTGLPQIFAIPDQIKQVLLNLFQNAADACHGNNGVITISTYHEDNKVAVAIKDNGIGIATDKFTQIFQPFYTTKSEVKGTGLGLSICHGIVQNHQGEIRVESEPGKGSTFIILLPIGGESA